VTPTERRGQKLSYVIATSIPQLFTWEKTDLPFEVDHCLTELLSHALGLGGRGRGPQGRKGSLIAYLDQRPGGSFAATAIHEEKRKRLDGRAYPQIAQAHSRVNPRCFIGVR
jgi:hypothetical protein